MLDSLGTDFIIVITVFIFFIILTYRFFRFLARAFFVGLLGLIFPIVANDIFGINVSTNIFSMLWFASLAIGLYIIYSILKVVFKGMKLIKKITSIITWPIRKIIKLILR